MFSTSLLRRYLGRPLREKLLHLGLVSLYGVTLLGATLLLEGLFQRGNHRTLAREALTPRTELIVLGTSRVYRGIDPRGFSVEAMNLASGWLDYVAMERVLEANLSRLPSLRWVILELDFPPLLFDTQRYLGELADLRSLKELGVSRDWSLGEILLQPDAALREALEPIFLWRLTPRELWERRHPEVEERYRAGFVEGRLAMPPTVRSPSNLGKVTARLSTGNLPRNREALLRLARSLKAREIRVIFVRLPAHRSFREHRPDFWNKAVVDTLASLRAELGEVTFWDLEQFPELTDDDFYDPYHLNLRGAVKLTEALGRRLSELERRLSELKVNELPAARFSTE